MNNALKKFLLTCPLALGTLVAPLVFGTQPVYAVLTLMVLGISMLLIDWDKKNLILYFCVFISGPLAEAIAIHFGAWNYDQPAFAGIPLWLPFVWGNASLYIIRLKEVIDWLFK